MLKFFTRAERQPEVHQADLLLVAPAFCDRAVHPHLSTFDEGSGDHICLDPWHATYTAGASIAVAVMAPYSQYCLVSYSTNGPRNAINCLCLPWPMYHTPKAEVCLALGFACLARTPVANPQSKTCMEGLVARTRSHGRAVQRGAEDCTGPDRR